MVKLRDKKTSVLCMIFIFILVLRFIGIFNPPLDYSSWRQADTDSIARNFVEYRFNILYPQLNYDGPMPNYVQLEFQVTTFIIALLYRIFGFKPVFGRAVPVVFFMGSCYYLYRLVKNDTGWKTAGTAVLIYGILPINVVYSRNIMPESALMFFMLGGIYYFRLWIDNDTYKYYIPSAAFTTLSVLTKLPSALIGIPMIYLSLKKYGWKSLKKIELLIFPITVFGLTYLYFYNIGKVAEQKFVEGIGSALILPNFLTAIFRKRTLIYLASQFTAKVFTVPGMILFTIGIFIRWRRDMSFYYSWLLAAALHVILVDAVIHLDYYLMFITPIISIFMALSCIDIIEQRRVPYLSYIAVILIVLNTLGFMKSVYKVQWQYIAIGDLVSNYTKKGDLIIIGKDSPELLYTCNRKGWRLYGNLQTEQNLEKLIMKGADYFVPYPPALKEGMKSYLDRNYEKVSFPGGYFIYKLKDRVSLNTE